MGATDFIKKRFLGEEICVLLMDSEAEIIEYDQSSAANREFFRGIAEEVEDGVLVLFIPKHGRMYIAEDFIRCFWEPGFQYYKAIETSITKRMYGTRSK